MNIFLTVLTNSVIMRLFFLLIFIFSVFSMPAQDEDLEKTGIVIKETKNIFSPDARTSVFEINFLKKDSLVILFGETNLLQAKEYLIKRLKEENIKLLDNITLLPSKRLNGKIYGIINLSAANIRSKPKQWIEMSNQAMLGSIVKVLKKENGWLLVQTPDDYIGWTEDDAVILIDEAGMRDWDSAEKIIFIEMYGTCFSKPDLNSLPVSDIILGNILKKLNRSGKFVKGEFPDKRTAFIPEESVTSYKNWISNLKPSAGEIIKTAKRFIGIPYLWGGTSVKGFDCSGFTKITYLMNGIQLPRDASQQINIGESVDTQNGFNNLMPGDLLFFGTKGRDTIPEKIQHVAIYLGNNDFIHSSGRVQINSLDKSKNNFSGYRYNTFLKAKRIIGLKKNDSSVPNSIRTKRKN
jgi:gamma-D-glutamyl-L-lysine dipeptidyl-peptidase